MKWEYCELEVTIGGPLTGTSAECHVFKADGKHKRYQGNYGQMMAVLGEEGWELVTSSARIEAGLSSKHKVNYVFKKAATE